MKEMRAQKCASESFSGFWDISNVSNVSFVSNVSLLMEKLAAGFIFPLLLMHPH